MMERPVVIVCTSLPLNLFLAACSELVESLP